MDLCHAMGINTGVKVWDGSRGGSEMKMGDSLLHKIDTPSKESELTSVVVLIERSPN